MSTKHSLRNRRGRANDSLCCLLDRRIALSPGGLLYFNRKRFSRTTTTKLTETYFTDGFVKTVHWLENRGEVLDRPLVKAQLMKRVKRLKPRYDKCVIDEFAKENNKIVMRLPPNHCELNPIGLAWSSVKHYVRINNTTFKLKDFLKLLTIHLDHLSADSRTGFAEHAVKEEEKYWTIDFITDKLLKRQPSRFNG